MWNSAYNVIIIQCDLVSQSKAPWAGDVVSGVGTTFSFQLFLNLYVTAYTQSGDKTKIRRITLLE